MITLVSELSDEFDIEYPLPHKVCMIDEIPLNKNGKKDRETLKVMAGGRK